MKKTLDIADILAAEAERFEREKDTPSKRSFGRPRKPEGEVGMVYSVRIPVERLEELRLLAVSKGEQPTGLMRKWILERLDRETGRVRKPSQRKVIDKIRSEREPKRPGKPTAAQLIRKDRKR